MTYSYPDPFNFVDGNSQSRLFQMPPLATCNNNPLSPNSTYIPKKPIPHNVKPYTHQLYNCARSQADPQYFQPFCNFYTPPQPLPPPIPPYPAQLPCDTSPIGCEISDFLYFQFAEPNVTSFQNNTPTPDPGNWSAIIHTPDNCEVLGPWIATQAITLDPRGIPYQILTVNTQYVPCIFHISFHFNTGTRIVSYYSEPFQQVSPCQETLVIKGIYPQSGTFAYDCNGNYYGNGLTPIDEALLYDNIIRIPGTIFNDRIEIQQDNERSYRTSIATASRTTEIYKLRTPNLPNYVIQQIKACMEAQIVLINGIAFEGNFQLSRSNELGCTWLIETELTTKPCIDRIFTC